MNELTYILIPAHNRQKTTLNCLQNLYEDPSIQSWDTLHVVVIDDGSTDGTEAAIRSDFPQVTIIKGDGNLWWTGAIHKGMQHAYARGAEKVFWLNDDCIPSPGSIKMMSQASIENGEAIIGAACYIAETDILKPTGAKGRSRKSAKPGELIPVDEMSGHCVCIPRTVIEAIGLPNVMKFPHYHGDSHYILKATRANFNAYILGDSRVTHAGQIDSRLDDFICLEDSDLIDSFYTTFLNKKSLYFLPTQYYYNLCKYGFFFGPSIFAAKCFHWLFLWAWFHFSSFTSSFFTSEAV